MRALVLLAVALLTASPALAQSRAELDARRAIIEQRDANATPDATARKARSIARMRAEDVPVRESLPVIEGESQALRRTKEEIAYRAMSLLAVAARGEGVEREVVLQVSEDYGLGPHFSPAERAFLNDRTPSDHDRIQFTWRYEAAWVMLWALGYVESLDRPDHICDVPQAIEAMLSRSAEQFIADARLRPHAEILDEADLIYRYHWAVVEARVQGEPVPAGLDPGVAMERHHALNWLIGYLGQAWDEVSTDT